MQSKKLLAISCAGAISAFGSVAQAADVVIGVPNWPSVLATAHVLKVAMENNLGLEVELQSGTNPVVFEAMDSGSIHVHPEVWLPNQSNLNQQYVAEKQSVRMNPNGVAGDQAMCVTNGWASTNVEKIRAKSYGYDATMNLKEMDETLALAEVDSAVTKDENIAFFCYTPHHMFALHELVILKEPAHDKAQWNVIQPTDDPEWLDKSNAPVAWSTAYLHIHYASALETDQPEAAAMLANVSLDTDTVSAMTYALVVDKKDPAEFAADWVEQNAETVDGWLQ